uniref:Uncharacterized protein n=1 Tax=Branchiostoma floridae TaxID=7739 RepID=C3XUC6_BRAFL|eukprot:XP_002612491.1 hypothetical protein BRAFLDRAFT_75394 [Branchiostoma floridae]
MNFGSGARGQIVFRYDAVKTSNGSYDNLYCPRAKLCNSIVDSICASLWQSFDELPQSGECVHRASVPLGTGHLVLSARLSTQSTLQQGKRRGTRAGLGTLGSSAHSTETGLHNKDSACHRRLIICGVATSLSLQTSQTSCNTAPYLCPIRARPILISKPPPTPITIAHNCRVFPAMSHFPPPLSAPDSATGIREVSNLSLLEFPEE